jgi:glycosyltransferase involved in cell wall biosynthesis
MKIDLIGPSYPFRGGISYYTTLLFKHLKAKHQTYFYCFRRQYPRFLFPGKTDREESGFYLREEESQPLLDALNPWTWLKVAGRVIRDRPALTIFPWWVMYWTPQYLTMIFLIKIFSKTKILFICHNVAEHEAHFLKTVVSRFVLSQGDGFIVHSEQEKENLKALTGKSRITVTYHPTYDVFSAAAMPKTSAREKLGLSLSDEKIILFFGFVREYKGLSYLIEALPLILARFKVRLLIVGEFWEDKKRYLRLIRKMGVEQHVTMIDRFVPNEDMPGYFYASDLVILPYTSVTGSGLIQLAYAFGRPVVTTSIGNLPEIVADKKTGFLVPPQNAKGIADAVVDFYENYDGEEMSARIKKEHGRFSWDHLIRAIEGFVP